MENEVDIMVDAESGNVEFVEISSDEQAAAFRKEIVIPYFKDIFKVSNFILTTPELGRKLESRKLEAYR